MTGGVPPLHNLEAEQSVLGAVLLLGAAALEPLMTEVALRPEHFYRPSLGEIYRAMLHLHDQAAGVDVLTVIDHLKVTGRLEAAGGEAGVHVLAASPPVDHHVSWYGQIVVRDAVWRARHTTALEQLEAVGRRDEDAYNAADTGRHVTRSGGDISPDLASTAFLDWYEPGGADPAIGLPFDHLNKLLRGGLHPGDTTVVAGWTSMGKSCLADQFLDHAASNGARCWAYLNEMSTIDRTARTLARLSGVPFEQITNRTLDQAAYREILEPLKRLPFGMTVCAGWPAEDIARHIRRHRWDLCVVDLVTRIPADKTADWDRISGVLTDAARQSGAHVLMVCQLNNARYTGTVTPAPSRRDLRNTGAWAQDAANVMFVHREQREIDGTGVPAPPDLEGHVRVDKARNGEPGILAVEFNPRRMRFETATSPLRSVA